MAKSGKKKVTIGLIQTQVSNDLDFNLKKTSAKIIEAAKKGAQIVCLQELYRTKYFPKQKKRAVSKFAETIPGESTSLFSKLAKKLKIVIIAPIFERYKSGKYYNTAVVIDDDGKILGTYRKLHIPHDPFFYEKSYFNPGDLGVQVFKTRYLNFAVLICYDQWYPEVARMSVLEGADLIFYPTAIGYLEGDPLSYGDWLNAWETIQRSHAIANGVHVAAVNRVGTEDKIRFWGSSFVCDAFGRVLARGSQKKDNVLVVEVDMGQNDRIREGWGFFNNRRPEVYRLIDTKITEGTPRQLGYQMPAEWEEHDATWLSWPYDPDTFPDRVHKVEKTYLEIIAALHKSEAVNLLVRDQDTKNKVEKLFGQSSIDPKMVNFQVWDYADVWFRDFGPIFLVQRGKKQLAMVHWLFNAWGGKYQELIKDGQIPLMINKEMQVAYFRPGIVLEGGSIDVNGKGSLLTTEQCLLGENRNPHLSKEEIEKYLEDYLGVNNVIWLKAGIEGDDTDGHIDDIARFVNPTTIVCAYEENEEDPNSLTLRENYDILSTSRDQDGKKFNVIKMPMPPCTYDSVRGENLRIPSSYLNFYIANKVILAPIFGHHNDETVLKILRKVFPGRQVIGIDCSDLVYGQGTIHCITQQQPKI